MSNNKDNYLKTLSQLFENPTEASQDKVLNLMDETVNFIKGIKEQLESGDPEAQKKALEETLEMKKMLESKMQKLAGSTGLDLNQLAALAYNPNSMTQEQRELVENKLKGLNKEEPKHEILINKI